MTTGGAVGRVSLLAPYAEQFQRAEPRPISTRLAGLDGRTIGFIYNGFSSNAIIHAELQALLGPQHVSPIAEHKKSFGRPLDPDQLERLATTADAVISGLCTTPPSTAWGVHDSIELEKRQIPTMTIATSYYEDLLVETAEAEGMPDLRRIILPYPLEGLPDDAVRDVARRMFDAVVAALTDPSAPTAVRL